LNDLRVGLSSSKRAITPTPAPTFSVTWRADRVKGERAIPDQKEMSRNDNTGRRSLWTILGKFASSRSLAGMDQNPTAAHAPRARLDDPGWDQIHQAYEAGEPPSILAERHGVSERTIRRRAAAEGWARRAPGVFGLSPGGPLGELTALDFFVKTRREETDELLLAPSPEGLLNFAFRRATEAAALGRPAEAGGWLRLVDQLRRNRDLMAWSDGDHDPADVRRAIIAEAIRDRQESVREARAAADEAGTTEP
jgi:hypothetical protein